LFVRHATHSLTRSRQAQNLVVDPNFPFAAPAHLRHFDKAANRTTTHSGLRCQVTTVTLRPSAHIPMQAKMQRAGERGAGARRLKDHNWQGENPRHSGTETGHEDRAEVYHG
ncbi:MAG: hypothetical protein ACO22Z_06475, partial [Paracoccaceae bacterium]